jgi:hypothetical protein
LPDRRGFPDVEQAEQGKADQETLPIQGGGAGQRDPLSDDLIDHHEPWVLEPGRPGRDGRGLDCRIKQQHGH